MFVDVVDVGVGVWFIINLFACLLVGWLVVLEVVVVVVAGGGVVVGCCRWWFCDLLLWCLFL